jgi:Ni,Fe-hydrogenase I large subunit
VALVAQFGNKELCLEAPIFVRPRRAVLYKHRLSCELGCLSRTINTQNKNDKRTKDDVYIKQHVSALQKMWLPKKAARVLHTPEDLGMLNFFVALVAQFGNKDQHAE